jgi:hypothetical protein
VGEPFDDRLSPNSEQAYFRSRFASEENRELAEVRHSCNCTGCWNTQVLLLVNRNLHKFNKRRNFASLINVGHL